MTVCDVQSVISLFKWYVDSTQTQRCIVSKHFIINDELRYKIIGLAEYFKSRGIIMVNTVNYSTFSSIGVHPVWKIGKYF